MRPLSLTIFTLLLLQSVYCGPYISTRPAILYSNGTEITWNTFGLKAKEFRNNTIIFDNLTQPPSAGLEGILYDRGYSCSVNNSSFGIKSPSVYTGGNRIALVKNGGNCNFYDKVYYSQLEGAAGVVIYDDIPFQEDPEAGIQKIAKGNITITMYYVDLDIGIGLTHMLQYASSQPIMTSDNISYQPVIHLVMHPDIGGFPANWIYILIIVIALLIVSFLASVGMHWHLWRIRRRQRTMFQSGAMDLGNTLNTPQLAKRVISSSLLDSFPTRFIGDKTCNLSRISSSHSSHSLRSYRALENADTVAKATASDVSSKQHENQDDVCVICLDEFSNGEQIRQLPCDHEFHTECIDPWLTVKSASCPLCKHDCYIKQESDNVEPETTLSSPPLPPPQSFFSSLRAASRSSSPSSAFGPTISADRAEEFSRSWMARSLPRNMRRQINEAALAAAAAHRETVIELPARMTQPVEGNTIPTPPLNNPRPRLSDRVKSSLSGLLRP